MESRDEIEVAIRCGKIAHRILDVMSTHSVVVIRIMLEDAKAQIAELEARLNRMDGTERPAARQGAAR